MSTIVKLLLPALFLSLVGCEKGNPVGVRDAQEIQIDYQFGLHDRLNTFEGFVQKDLVLDGVIKTDFWLSTPEQISILEVVDQVRFFEFPDTIRRQPGVTMEPDFSPDVLRIHCENQEKTVVWFYPMENSPGYTDSLQTLITRIRDVLFSNSIYRKLPPPRGGYD